MFPDTLIKYGYLAANDLSAGLKNVVLNFLVVIKIFSHLLKELSEIHFMFECTNASPLNKTYDLTLNAAAAHKFHIESKSIH